MRESPSFFSIFPRPSNKPPPIFSFPFLIYLNKKYIYCTNSASRVVYFQLPRQFYFHNLCYWTNITEKGLNLLHNTRLHLIFINQKTESTEQHHLINHQIREETLKTWNQVHPWPPSRHDGRDAQMFVHVSLLTPSQALTQMLRAPVWKGPGCKSLPPLQYTAVLGLTSFQWTYIESNLQSTKYIACYLSCVKSSDIGVYFLYSIFFF